MINKLLKSRNIKDGLGFLATNLFTQILAFVFSIFVIRELGPELRGYYTFLGLLGLFLVPIFSFGFQAGLSYYIASKKYKSIDITVPVIVISFLRGVVMIIAVILLKELNLLGATGNRLSVWYILPILLTFPFNMMKESFQRMLLSDSFYKKANTLNIINSIVSPTMVFILVVVFKLAMIGVVISIVSSNIITFVITVIVIEKYYKVINLKKTYNKAFIKDVFNYGIKGWIGDIAVTSNNRVDQLILSFFLSPVSLGLYSICANIGQIVWIMPSAFRQILFNKNAEMTTESDRKKFTSRYHAFFLITGLILAGTLVLLAKKLVYFLYGSAFLEAVLPLQIYLIGTGIYIGTLVLTKYFGAIKKIIINSYIQIFSALIGILAALLLVPIFGLVGAALSSTISYILSYILAVYFFKDLRSLRMGFIFLKGDLNWRKKQPAK